MQQTAEQNTTKTISWIRTIFTQNNKKKAVIAVSGGIDSAVALTLLTRALDAENIFPLVLPYKDQSCVDAQTILTWNAIPAQNCQIHAIDSIVAAAASITAATSDPVRMGNYMARARMLLVFDRAKQLDALVCGTENRSEHYLGYFTRFGDAASDLEPLAHLYKTEVRACAEYLKLPDIFLSKAPSAGLWSEQTDELELGFSYAHADAVCRADYDGETAALDSVPPEITKKVRARIQSQQFKQQVPYLQQAQSLVLH